MILHTSIVLPIQFTIIALYMHLQSIQKFMSKTTLPIPAIINITQKQTHIGPQAYSSMLLYLRPNTIDSESQIHCCIRTSFLFIVLTYHILHLNKACTPSIVVYPLTILSISDHHLETSIEVIKCKAKQQVPGAEASPRLHNTHLLPCSSLC